MSVSPAERDAKREQAFALSLLRISQRRIAELLSINKETVNNYVRIERRRRSHDRNAEDVIRDVVAMLRASLLDLFEQLRKTTGTGPMTGIAKAMLGRELRGTARELVLVYGVKLPKIDGEEIAMDRHMEMDRTMEMVQEEIDAPISGYPDVSEDAAYDEHIAEAGELLKGIKQWKQGRRQAALERLQQKELERDQLGELERRQREELERRGLSLEDVLDSHDDHVECF